MDVFSRPKRSDVMSRIRSRGNKTTEVPMLAAMRKIGVKGWRRHVRVKIGKFSVRPDFVFRKHRVAIFVDGCFWHGCPEHGSRPKSNQEFWDRKLEANSKRDRLVNQTLTNAGWVVLRFWEHSSRRDSDNCAKKIAVCLGRQTLHRLFRA